LRLGPSPGVSAGHTLRSKAARLRTQERDEFGRWFRTTCDLLLRLRGTNGYHVIAVWYHSVPMSRLKDSDGSAGVRGRILTAAFEAFVERGYAATSTLEIATRARVSKRELYAVVGNKQKMLVTAIGERAKRLL